METVTVKASRSYQVEIEGGALPTLGARLTSLLPRAKQVMLVSDSTVAALYGEIAETSLCGAGLQVHRFVFPSGEASKTPATLCALWCALAEASLSRTDAIVALGGGVVGDLSGFAAATYLRGIACYQVPTTLLAMVDSSVGGKTAVDLPAGKNLCGAFSQPVGVLCDPQVLKTLPSRVYADGCAEVIKYGYIGDPTLLKMLEQPFAEAPEAVIARCVRSKRDVVEADEHDNGARQLLNLGHTGAHAIERLSNFSISHGEAVAIGMLLAARGAVVKGLCAPDVPAHVEAMLQRYHLPTECPFDADAMAEAALSDKKRRGGEITLVLPRKLGESVLVPTPVEELAAFFAAGGAKA
ncbi:MAG: 3-dehydroquinate synthase [Ruminococcaceae bacterium]|nr:3-dehydroquinate synthase [Oscillospiraceae bacterium]